MSDNWIPPAEWEVIVKNVPIVSVDLVVRSPEGVVLGKRTNKPAKEEWFVPGGRLHKLERLKDAIHRLANEELGIGEVVIKESLGAYEHIYKASDVDDSGGKHYLANGFVIETETTVNDMTLDNQHGEVRAFASGEYPDDLHEYTAAYLCDAASVPYSADEHL